MKTPPTTRKDECCDRAALAEKVERMKEKHGWMPLGKGDDPWNKALDDVLAILRSEV